MRYLVAVGTLVSAFALFACGGDDDTQNVAVTNPGVTLTSATVVAVTGVALAIPNGQILGTAPNSAATLTFVNQNSFTLLDSQGRTSQGTVTYGTISTGSCTFNVPQTPGFIALATTVTFTVCNLNITAIDVEQGGDQVLGTLNIVFSGLPGTIITNNFNANVFLDDDGNLFVVNPVSGLSVPMNVQP
jgi:hypothetical protein